MKTTTIKKLNVSRAINDAVKLCELIRKMDKTKTMHASSLAGLAAFRLAYAMRKRYGKKTVVFHTRTFSVKSRFYYRVTDITIRTGKGSNIIISERSRFPRFVI